MSVQVIIPAAPADDVTRVAARQWVAARYAGLGLPVTIATGPPGDWSKGAAVNPAAATATAQMLVIADADSYVAADHLERAMTVAQRVGWAMPHSIVKRLSRASTTDILADRPCKPRLERGAYPALPGGGIIVCTREAWSTIGGFDPRFRGWGGEDHAIGLALRTLVAPVPPRTPAPLWHLWHTPAAHCRRPTQATRDLDARYRAARDKPDLMRQIVTEWRMDDPDPALATLDAAHAHTHH